MQTPELPPFEHEHQPYRGHPRKTLRSRRQFLNPGPLPLLQTKIQHQYTQIRTLMRFHAAETPPNPTSTAAMSAIIKQRGLPEDNIIVARNSQSGRRAC